MEKARETVDLISSQGIDWSAFLTLFNNLRIEDGYQNLEIKELIRRCSNRIPSKILE